MCLVAAGVENDLIYLAPTQIHNDILPEELGIVSVSQL